MGRNFNRTFMVDRNGKCRQVTQSASILFAVIDWVIHPNSRTVLWGNRTGRSADTLSERPTRKRPVN